MDPLSPLLRQYLFLIPLTVLFLSEMSKVMIDTVREKESIWSGKWLTKLFQSGGIPSTHSAFVTSLLIVIGKKSGLESTEFAIAFVFACVVWYDAMCIRRVVGNQSEVLNRLQAWRQFSERIGHSFLEVLAGIMFGAVVTMVGIYLS